MATQFTAGCFGKVPAYEDFIRFEAGSAEARALEKWFHAGLAHIRAGVDGSWERRFLQAPIFRFLWQPAAAGSRLFGAFAPAADRSRRLFPIVAFGAGPPASPAADIGAALRCASGMLAACESFVDPARIATNPREIINAVAALGTLAAAVPPAAAGDGSHQTMGALWAGLFGDPADRRREVVLQNLAEIVAPFRRRPGVGLHLGLRFPLPASRPAEEYVAFWVNLLSAVLGRPLQNLAVFWHSGTEARAPRLIFLGQPPATGDFGALLGLSADTGTICDLEVPWPGTALGRPVRPLLDNLQWPPDMFFERVHTTFATAP